MKYQDMTQLVSAAVQFQLVAGRRGKTTAMHTLVRAAKRCLRNHLGLQRGARLESEHVVQMLGDCGFDRDTFRDYFRKAK